MPFGNLDFDEIQKQNIYNLIETGVPEGFKIEYKRELYGKADSDKKEALKDISSFANSFGGHIVIGIEEKQGIPIEVKGLENIDPDNEIARLENLIRDGIEPRISGAKIKAISIAAERFVIVVRVPKSWNPPHRVSAKNTNRFYVRNSAGVHEASVEELRTIFSTSATIRDRVKSFRKERLAILSVDEGPKRIEHGGRLIIHIVPFSAFTDYETLDVNNIFTHQGNFRPIADEGYTDRFNFEGFLNYRGGDKCFGYTQIFRNGSIEATKASIIRERNGARFLPAHKFCKDIIKALPKYINGLKSLNVPPPIAVMISLQEINNVDLAVEPSIFDDTGEKIQRSELLLPEILIESYGTDQTYQKALRPAFDALWNSAGYAFCKYFNEDDLWIGQ